MKKIIASILAIAMIASMFTMVFSANTEAKTNYSEKVEKINDLVDTLLEVGPAVGTKAFHNAVWKDNNSQARIATGWELGDGTVKSYSIAGELGRFDGRFDSDELAEQGVDINKLISDATFVVEIAGEDVVMTGEEYFLYTVAQSDAITAVVNAFGYETVEEAVEDLKLYNDYRTAKLETFTLSDEVKANYTQKGAGKKINKNSPQEAFEAILAEISTQEGFTMTEVEDFSDAQEIFLLVLTYVTSANRFGMHADAEWFAPEFNANRNVVYDLAITAAEDLIKAFRAQVTVEGPYAEEYDAYVNFEATSEALYEEAVYNESYGINPWIVTYGPDFDLIANVNIIAGYQWMTFEEIAAYSEKAAQLLTSLQAQLRAASLFNVNGVLYVEFIDKVEELYDTFEALCWELVGGKLSNTTTKDYSAVKDTVKAMIKLWSLETLYTLYIEENLDLYAQTVANISTIYNLEAQIRMARTIIDDVNYDEIVEWYDGANGYWTVKFTEPLARLWGLNPVAIENFIANIEANIAALVPAAGQKITAAEVAEGLALYKKVGNLLAYYAEEAGEIASYKALDDLYMGLANYLPATAGANAVASTFVEVWYLDGSTAEKQVELVYGVKPANLAAAEVDVDFVLEFAPVAYTYLTLIADVEDALEAFELEVSKLSTDAPDLGTYPVDELVAVMDKYDFLASRDIFVDGEEANDEDTILYFYLLTGYTDEATVAGFDTVDNEDVKFGPASFLALTIGDPVGEADAAYDYAVRNYSNFFNVFNTIRSTYATEWEGDGYYYNGYEYVDGEKLDFSGDFSILDVTIGSNEALLKKLIAELEAAAALLCVNVTDRIAMYAWVNAELAEIFELTLDNAAYAVNAEATGYGVAANYVEGELANLAKAMTALNQLIDRYYNGKDAAVTDRATPAKLDAAFEAVKEAFYALLTIKGAACADAYFTMIEKTLAYYVYGNSNTVADVEAALDAHVVSLTKYFPGEAELRPYEYFAWTLKTIAQNTSSANLYSLTNKTPAGETYFAINFHNAFAKAVAGVNAIVTGQYPTAVREDAAKLAFFANDILAGINGGAFDQNDWNANNMPLWYALELSTYLQEYVAEAAKQHASALQALKAEVLAPVIAEAETIQTAFLAKAMPIVMDYDAAQLVMANSKNGALYIYTAEDIQKAAEALAAEVELAKAELGEAVYTVEDVLALIDAAVASAEARATGMAADFKALRVAAADAKTAIGSGAYNQTTYVNNVVAAANAALEALVDVELADEDLYTPASYEAYEAAYNTLMDVVDINAEVELTVAEALAAFKAAEAELVLIADATGAMYEAAKAAYEAALTVDETKYTAESYAAFAAAVEALKAAIDNYASEAELQAAIVNVKVAEVQLVAAPVGEVGTLDD